MLQHIAELQLHRAGEVLAHQVAQVALPRDEADQGTGRSALVASTSFTSFVPSRLTKLTSAAWLASQSTSSSRNRMTAS